MQARFYLAQIDEMLTESSARLARLRRFSPLAAKVTKLTFDQRRLEDWRARVVSGQSQNLGLVGLVIGAAIAGLSALGIRAWQHREETQKVEEERGLINDLLAKGYNLEDIAKIYGDKQSSLDKLMSRMVILTAVIGGIIVFWKLK